jgi:hypothetical protein
MSYFDYKTSLEIAAQDHSFYGIIMAAMRKADTNNIEKLRTIYPKVWEELKARYNAPGGKLEGDDQCEIDRRI